MAGRPYPPARAGARAMAAAACPGEECTVAESRLPAPAPPVKKALTLVPRETGVKREPGADRDPNPGLPPQL